MPWLTRGDDVLATADLAVTRRQRRVGLRGRSDVDGVLVIDPCRSVHTFGMRFPIDVAFCDRDGVVLHVVSLKPRRLSRVVWRAGFVVEARCGAFETWGLEVGDVVEVKGHEGGD